MYNHEEKENDRTKTIFSRLNVLLLVVFLIFSAMIFRLSYVQIVKGAKFEKEASAKSDKKIPILAMRGNIYDRNGNLIVHSQGSFTAVFQEKDYMNEAYYVNLVTKLEKILTGTKKEDLLKKMDVGYEFKNGKVERTMRMTSKFLEKDLKYDLSQKEIAYLAEHRSDLDGITVVTKPIRVYDPNQVAVQTIGYVRPFNVTENQGNEYYLARKDSYLPNQMVGYDGIERSYEEQLRGENGYRLYQVAANQTILQQIKEVPPTRGNNLYLTIDDRVQLDTRNFIRDFLPKLRGTGKNAYNARNAYAVAIEVKTGRVVATVSYPEYDPNIWTSGPDKETYEANQYSFPNGTISSAPHDVRPKTGDDAALETYRHPASILPSGSALKPATVLTGLAEKVITPYDTWSDPGAYRYGSSAGDVIHNDSNHNYGLLTPQRALKFSSNTYMARVGKALRDKLGKDTIFTYQKYLRAFGLGIKTGVDLPNESSGKEDFLVMNAKYGPTAAMVQASFGQQGRYTTMQLAQYAATLASKGVRYRPQLVDRIVDNNGKVVQSFKPEVLSKLNLPDEYWRVVHEGMVMVTTESGGTAVGAFAGFPYHVAAKTGTSQQDIYVPSSVDFSKKVTWHKANKINNGVFVSFAPAEDPKLAVAVIVPEGGYGSQSAGMIARAIYDSYNKHVGLGPTDKPYVPATAAPNMAKK
ncbi:penicillin-binding protein 2 [Aneurinibacillus soli]|uniref:Penicillin-binding protein 2B n=1 Tax=Aneurinibacillus soli TaxID=1500254 RepID=A0A0U5AZB7_9BACL|nr:penicillin-binding transpeptidase domain-containing protein [Aneurinibacillus soli]PYE62817.1 penicillin-binding protein 2 [Aneurinibacillus soli]BAU29125.1 Penicillin-binding protein 2B [Aneurinibacillus soli]